METEDRQRLEKQGEDAGSARIHTGQEPSESR